MGESESRVSDKEEPTTTTTNNNNNNNNNTGSSCVLGSGVKLQNLQNKMTMMLHHHHNHNRSFDNDDGPTTYMSFTGATSAPLGAAHDGAAVMRPLHISAYSSATTTTFKSPGGNGMAASLGGFPFTTAQWKELQRQAMIYKYIMASIPVPSDLLIPTTIATSLDGGFNLRTDPEPGRCRRTDGKKWRCARDVAPSHKYCERHMHRGRPRSRKPVEVQPNNNDNNNNHQIKKPRHDPNPKFTVANTATKDGSSSQFLDNNYFGVKGFNFGSVPPSVSSNKQPRGLEWMLNGDPISLGASSDSGWQSLMHNKVEINTNQLNSLPLYSSGMDQQNRHLPMFFNPLIPMESFHQSEKPRSFIDAWSNADTGENSANSNKNSTASNGKLSLTSLDLSMGGGNVNEKDMGTIMEPDGNTQHNGDTTKISPSNWLNPTPPWVASPLAEVLRPSTVTTTSDATSNQSSGPLGTMISSPSGVLHKTLASFSDSSDNSSPTVASSRANSEIPLLKFN